MPKMVVVTSARRLRWWQGALGLVTGAVASQLVGGIPVLVAVIAVLVEQGPLANVDAEIAAAITSFTVLGPSIVLTGGTMAGVAVLTAVVFKARPLRSSLGFRRAHWLAFVVAPIGILGLGPLSDGLRRWMQHVAPTLTFGALEGLDAVARSAPLWVIVPAMALVPGFAEELLFRGMFQRAIRNRVIAVLMSGLLFAGIHLDPHHVIAIVPLGLYLAWLGDRTNSVLVPMFAHMCNNAAAVVGSRFMEPGEAPEALDWWYIPIGLVITLACLGATFMVTRDARRQDLVAPMPGAVVARSVAPAGSQIVAPAVVEPTPSLSAPDLVTADRTSEV